MWSTLRLIWRWGAQQVFIIIFKRKTNTHIIYMQTHICTHMYTHTCAHTHTHTHRHTQTHTKLYQFMVYVAVFPVVPVSTPSAGAAASHVMAEGHCHHSTLVHCTGQCDLHCFVPCCLLFMPPVKGFTLLSSFSNSFFLFMLLYVYRSHIKLIGDREQGGIGYLWIAHPSAPICKDWRDHQPLPERQC